MRKISNKSENRNIVEFEITKCVIHLIGFSLSKSPFSYRSLHFIQFRTLFRKRFHPLLKNVDVILEIKDDRNDLQYYETYEKRYRCHKIKTFAI